MRALEIIGAVVAFAVLLGLAVLIAWGQQSGAADYMARRGYVVQTFESQAFQSSCTMSKDRRKYNFTATRNGQPVRGYLCYGGITEAKIHEEAT